MLEQAQKRLQYRMSRVACFNSTRSAHAQKLIKARSFPFLRRDQVHCETIGHGNGWREEWRGGDVTVRWREVSRVT